MVDGDGQDQSPAAHLDGALGVSGVGTVKDAFDRYDGCRICGAPSGGASWDHIVVYDELWLRGPFGVPTQPRVTRAVRP